MSDNNVSIDKGDLNFLISLLKRVYEGDELTGSDIDSLEEIKGKDLTQRIYAVLQQLGVRPGIRGYDYLKYGIQKVIEKPAIIHEMTYGLYPLIADNFHTTGSRVERAIRHSVELAFDTADGLDLKEQLFGSSLLNRDKPTNTQFIAAIAEYLTIN